MVDGRRRTSSFRVVQTTLRDEFGRNIQVEDVRECVQGIPSIHWLSSFLLLGPEHEMSSDDCNSTAVGAFLSDRVDGMSAPHFSINISSILLRPNSMASKVLGLGLVLVDIKVAM